MNRKIVKEKISDMMFDLCKYTLTGSVIVNLLGDDSSHAIVWGSAYALICLSIGIILIEKGGKK